jgi:hypothetical protein
MGKLLIFVGLAFACVTSVAAQTPEHERLKVAQSDHVACVKEKVGRFAVGTEPADTIADGALGLCWQQREAVLHSIRLILKDDESGAQTLIRKNDTKLRAWATGRVLEIRQGKP